MVSIKDISKKCGVSVATVSKALNDCADISEVTKKKVREAAKELGYFPNSQAKALKTSKTKTIGIIYTDKFGNGLSQNYFSSVIDSFKVAVEKEGYDIIFIGANSSVKGGMSYYEHCRYRNVDGVLVACVDFYDRDVNALLRSDLPVVSLDFFSKRDYSVYSDNRQGIRDIVEYVYEMGHRKIGYIYGDTSQVTTVRLDTYIETMKQLGLQVEIDYVRQGRYNDIRLAKKITGEMMSLHDPPTCLLMPDDIALFGAFMAVGEMGLKIPDDLSVVGYDGIQIGQIMEPNITTVYQDTKLLGIKSAELLLRRIRNEEIPDIQKQMVIETGLLRGQTVKDLT
jgi:DNA-binding LacI/PurR family transcriptional regulator